MNVNIMFPKHHVLATQYKILFTVHA